MMIIQSPSKNKQKTPQKSPEKERGAAARRTKPPTAPFFAPKNLAATSANPIPSSSPAFATPAHPLRPFNAPVPAKAAILPIILPPATLRPLAFRTFTKKHSLTLTSSALQELATFIGRHCGSGWREEGLAEKVLEEAARSWKNRNGGVIVDGASTELKDILKTLEGNMSGGKIVTGNSKPGMLSRQNSLLLEPTQDADYQKTRLGLRPTQMTLAREDSQTSLGMSGLDFSEEPDDEGVKDIRRWLRVIDSYQQPRFTYNVAKKHFERETSKPSLLPPASHKTEAFRNRFNVIHQRLMRNESFQTSAVAGARASSSSLKRAGNSSAPISHRLTPIANLLGRHGTHHMLLGMLVILPTGSLAISDLTGTITLDLSHAVMIPADSAWFTPGMIVLVDGVYEEEEEHVGKGLSGSSGVGGTIGGKFQGFFIGQPPCEKRKATLGVSGLDGQSGSSTDKGSDHTIGGGFGWIDFLGVGSERAVGSKMRKLENRILRQPALADNLDPAGPAGRARVIILGELNLDKPRSLQALRKILSLYASDPDGARPAAFVLAGNFASTAVMARGATGGSIEYKEYFDALASTLAEFPSLLTSSTFCFVPGDNDGWVSSFEGGAAVPLPRKGVPSLFTSRVRRAFASANSEAGLGTNSEKGGPVGGEAVFTSNPARISLFGPTHEFVLFRDDISARLRRASVRLKNTSQNTTNEGEEDVAMSGSTPAPELQTQDPDDDDVMEVDTSPVKKQPAPPGEQEIPTDVLTARKLVKTILDQGHLAPFRQAVRPVHWDYHSVMHLYPLPTVLVLVDTTAPSFCVTYEGCHVMNPGSILVPGKRGAARWIEYDVLGRIGRVREGTF